MSRGKNITGPIRSRPQKSKPQRPSPPSQRAADSQPHLNPASIAEISSRQPIALRAIAGAEPTMSGLGELLGSLLDFIAEFDKTGVLLQVWTGNESLLIRPVDEMMGKPWADIIGGDEYRPFCGLFERIHSSGVAEDLEYSLNLADGLHWFIARAIPVVASDSGERTIRVLVQDVTRLRKTEAHSRKMESLLAHTQEIARVGSWEYDTERRTFLWSEQMYRMLGLGNGSEAIGLTKACQMFHPDDRARVWQDVTTLIETGQPLENELRFLTACGETRTFFSRAIPVKDESGAVRLIRGFSQDVTERRAA
jgi:PAS domain S-box-containing protein